jgi:hypothetical protein
MLGCAPDAAASWKEVRDARQATGVIVSCGFRPLSLGYAGAGLVTAFASLATTFIAGSGRGVAAPRKSLGVSGWNHGPVRKIQNVFSPRTEPWRL